MQSARCGTPDARFTWKVKVAGVRAGAEVF
jgi:hypothetical protein